MIVLTVVGTTYGEGMTNNGTNKAEYDEKNLAATESVQTTYSMY